MDAEHYGAFKPLMRALDSWVGCPAWCAGLYTVRTNHAHYDECMSLTGPKARL